MHKLIAAAVALSCLACVSTSAVGRAGERQHFTLEEAQAIVASLEAKGPEADKAPATLDEAVEILKADDISHFDVGASFAATDTTPAGKALAAQLQLAWGEDQHIVSDLIDRATFNLNEELQSLLKRESIKGLSEKEAARKNRLEKALDEMSGVSNALTQLGDQHITQGIALAKEVIAASPNEYLGYRVAADYYRLTEDWAAFDTTVKKLEELNPTSNGLVFARAMEALQRNGDRSKAVDLLKKALETDPKFTRARAQLLLAQPNIDAAWAEFEALKAAQPHHQIVAWVGPTLEAEREALIAAAERATDRQLGGVQNLRPR